MNGEGRRKCRSWIDSFVEHTDNLEAPSIFRKWTGITAVAATLEQKVWMTTTGNETLWPNLYVFIIGHPGVGKSRSITKARKFLNELPDFHFAPTSMTAAALVDALTEAKRSIVRHPEGMLEYNNLFIGADEISAFMHKYDDEMIGMLTTLYDVEVPYSQHRRGKDIRIKIKHPSLTILSGSTPSNLMKFMPENAWDQGFTSRIIMVFSDERIIHEDLFRDSIDDPTLDLVHDLNLINALSGKFEVTEDYKEAVNDWRRQGQPPVPIHPKLTHYSTRRLAHLLKLSMVACVEQSDVLLLTMDSFNRAKAWLLEAELHMPDIFKAGSTSSDSRVMDDIYHFIFVTGTVNEHKLVDFAAERMPLQSVLRTIEVMEKRGQIKAVSIDPKNGLRNFQAVPKASE